MTLSRVAVEIFQCVRVDAALAGDLLEERIQGRSMFWFWKEVAAAVWAAIWRDIFGHKLLAVRALATGCAVNAVWLFLWHTFLHIGLPFLPHFSLEAVAALLIILSTQAVTGWVVGRTHGEQAIAMVFVFAMWLVLWFPLNVDLRYLRMLLAESIEQPRLGLYLAIHIFWIGVPLVTELAGLFAGGAAAARGRRAAA